MQYRKPRISRVIYPHAFAHFETQSPSEKKGRPADRLSCIIEVRNSLKGEHMAAEERIGAQSTFSRVILHATVSSGFVAAYLRGILDVNSRKGYRQSGRLAGFGSQERSLVSVSVVTESGGVEVRNLQRVLPISTLFADSTTLLVACVATLGHLRMFGGGVLKRRRLVCLAGESGASHSRLACCLLDETSVSFWERHHLPA
jgi:hypothetical protein